MFIFKMFIRNTNKLKLGKKFTSETFQNVYKCTGKIMSVAMIHIMINNTNQLEIVTNSLQSNDMIKLKTC